MCVFKQILINPLEYNRDNLGHLSSEAEWRILLKNQF